MKFGVRQIANVVFRANSLRTIGNKTFEKGQPVFYLDTAKTSSMESSATTVYATGGRGNTRLVTWEGEKTLTFNVEDALLSPISFAILSGAGVIKGAEGTSQAVHFHQTTRVTAKKDPENSSQSVIDLSDAILDGQSICSTAPIYVMKVDEIGDLTGEISTEWTASGRKLTKSGTDTSAYVVDYYVNKNASHVTELQIDAGSFGGSYYVEADTLFRTQTDNKDYPANITFPNVKIQSNFTFSMAASGDPSTFSFVMDAMLGYTYFNTNKKVLCAIQIADDNPDTLVAPETVFPHPAKTEQSIIVESTNDSVSGNIDGGDVDYSNGAVSVEVPYLTFTSDGTFDSGSIMVTYVYSDGRRVSTKLTGGDGGDFTITDNSNVLAWNETSQSIKGTISEDQNAMFTIVHNENENLTTKFIVDIDYQST